MPYRLIGLDLDGTLLNRRGHISADNLAAIRKARAQGVVVVPCTGRGWSESQQKLVEFGHGAPAESLGVFVGGAIICDLTTGKTLHSHPFTPELARRIIAQLHDGPDAILIFCDAAQTGYDYLITGRGELAPNTRWWFDTHLIKRRHKTDLDLGDLQHVLRIGLVATPDRVRQITATLRQTIGPEITSLGYAAVKKPNDPTGLYVLEVFPPDVHKWRGMAWIAQRMGIGSEQVAVIGDEVNDLAMIASAGCGIAMGNAQPQVKEQADHITLDCDAHGVAHAIEHLLAGRWGR